MQVPPPLLQEEAKGGVEEGEELEAGVEVAEEEELEEVPPGARGLVDHDDGLHRSSQSDLESVLQGGGRSRSEAGCLPGC